MTSPHLQPRRPGAALVLAILLLVVLDCIVIGTLQVAAQQRRLADNRTQLLRALLAAEGAVRRALVEWPREPLPPDDAITRTARVGGHVITIQLEQLDADLVLITALAEQDDGGSARYSAALLARPPALPSDRDLAATALSASSVTLQATGTVTAVPPSSCAEAGGAAVRTDGTVTITPGGTIDGAIAPNDPGPVQLLDRIAARTADGPTGLAVASGDTTVHGAAFGVLVAAGTVIIAPDAQFDGLVLARGGVTIEGVGTIHGAAHVAGQAVVSGTIVRDPCAVTAALATAGLTVARPVRGRSWIPAFHGP